MKEIKKKPFVAPRVSLLNMPGDNLLADMLTGSTEQIEYGGNIWDGFTPSAPAKSSSASCFGNTID